MEFKTWANKAIKIISLDKRKASTFNNCYLSVLNCHLLPYFGDKQLEDIKASSIREFVHLKEIDYCNKSIEKMLTCLNAILEMAYEDDLIIKNPIPKIKINSQKNSRQKKAWTIEEYNLAWNYAKSTDIAAHICTLMETGITRSELLGLKVEDFDFTNKTLHINNGLTETRNPRNGQYTLINAGLKNKYRNRVIPISKELADIIKQHINKTKVSEFIFVTPKGLLYYPTNWSHRIFENFMNKLISTYPNITKLTAHELRHTRASILFNSGKNPLAIAKYLGHRDLSMLMRTYTHSNPEDLRYLLSIK